MNTQTEKLNNTLSFPVSELVTRASEQMRKEKTLLLFANKYYSEQVKAQVKALSKFGYIVYSHTTPNDHIVINSENAELLETFKDVDAVILKQHEISLYIKKLVDEMNEEMYQRYLPVLTSCYEFTSRSNRLAFKYLNEEQLERKNEGYLPQDEFEQAIESGILSEICDHYKNKTGEFPFHAYVDNFHPDNALLKLSKEQYAKFKNFKTFFESELDFSFQDIVSEYNIYVAGEDDDYTVVLKLSIKDYGVINHNFINYKSTFYFQFNSGL